MSSLYNSSPVPPGLRCCYWDADYIASQPFCISSRLTDKEAKDLAEFEEFKFWERNENLKQELFQEILNGTIDDDYLDQEPEVIFIDVKKAVDAFMFAPKKFYFAGFAKPAKKFGFYNIQTSGRVLPKLKQETQQLRAFFLTR